MRGPCTFYYFNALRPTRLENQILAISKTNKNGKTNRKKKEA